LKPQLVVWLDECGIHVNITQKWSWFPAGRDRVPVKVPKNEGKRWNLIHAIHSGGFISAGPWLELSEKGDIHETITYGVFEDWVVNYLFPSIKGQNAIIVLDNARFHSRVTVSRSSMTKPMMQHYLDDHYVKWTKEMKKKDLLQLIDSKCPIQPQLVSLCREHGHYVLWLPAYHPTLNPIELVWNIIKGSMRRQYNGRTISRTKFKEHFDRAIASVTVDVVNSCINKAMAAVAAFAQQDGIDPLTFGREKDDEKRALPPVVDDPHDNNDINDMDEDDDDDDDGHGNGEGKEDAPLWTKEDQQIHDGRNSGVTGISSRGRVRRKPTNQLHGKQLEARLWYELWALNYDKSQPV
jgi:hypothetical protein